MIRDAVQGYWLNGNGAQGLVATASLSATDSYAEKGVLLPGSGLFAFETTFDPVFEPFDLLGGEK
jgi:hypothetical protein